MDSLKRVEIVTPPAIEPVTLEEVKALLRITNDRSDALLTSLIPVARQMVEEFVNITLIETEFKQVMDYVNTPKEDPWWNGVVDGHMGTIFGGDPGQFELRRRPLIAVSAFKYFLADNTEQTFDPALYRVSNVGKYFPGRLALKTGEAWPSNGETRASDGLEVQFTAGFPPVGAEPDPSDTAAHDAWLRSGVPNELKHAVLVTVGYLYDNPGACGCGGSSATSSGLPPTADLIVNRWILPRV